MFKSNTKDKENRKSLEPRWSLKPQIVPHKLQGRMSMLPLRKSNRQSFSTINSNLQAQFKTMKNLRNTTVPLTQQRPSLLNNTINLNNSSCNQNSRKEVIINNLVNKLDQQEEIRSIIQQKLKNNSYQSSKKNFNSSHNHNSQNNFYTSQFQPYSCNHNISNFGQTFSSFNSNQLTLQAQSNPNLVKKLRKCEQQIEQFKLIVQSMSEKIRQLTIQNNSQDGLDENCFIKSRDKNFMQRESLSKNKKRIKQISTQTQWSEKQADCKVEQEGPFDFLDNLDRTLKILNNNKKIR